MPIGQLFNSSINNYNLQVYSRKFKVIGFRLLVYYAYALYRYSDFTTLLTHHGQTQSLLLLIFFPSSLYPIYPIIDISLQLFYIPSPNSCKFFKKILSILKKTKKAPAYLTKTIIFFIVVSSDLFISSPCFLIITTSLSHLQYSLRNHLLPTGKNIGKVKTLDKIPFRVSPIRGD